MAVTAAPISTPAAAVVPRLAVEQPVALAPVADRLVPEETPLPRAAAAAADGMAAAAADSKAAAAAEADS